MLSRTHPPVRGTVRTWSDEQGWGVVDSHQTPGGCWVAASAVVSPGPATLVPGTGVELTWVDADQDGYLYRALSVRPDGVDPSYERPAAPQAGSGPEAGAYSGALGLGLGLDLGPGSDLGPGPGFVVDVPVDVPVTPEQEPPRAG